MIITNAKYIKDRDGNNTAIEATIDGIVWGVPLAPDNTHYAEIQKQVKEGKLTIKDAD